MFVYFNCVIQQLNITYHYCQVMQTHQCTRRNAHGGIALSLAPKYKLVFRVKNLDLKSAMST